jgi:CheY-like chemotaxis protein
MHKVKLIHWNAEEAEQRALILQYSGYLADSKLDSGTKILKSLTEDPPAAIIIDLSRLPSQGRDIALTVRKRKGTRYIPLIFVDGDPVKVEGIKELLPDARYTGWDHITVVLAEAIANPPTDPVVHDSTFAAYVGKPLVEKLGIKPAMRVVLVNPPINFEGNLKQLRPDVRIIMGKSSDCDLTIWFCRSTAELEHQIPDIVEQSHCGPVWIAWLKQKSTLASDLTQQIVRQTGLRNGLVDYKISSFDDTWSGLLFRLRQNN